METEIPNEFLCPISMDIMSDPVICEDGYTYDRECIAMINNNISPMTRQRINKHNLIPNRALKDAIERFKRTNNIPTITEERRREIIENIMRINREELKSNARDEMVFQIRNEITEQTRQEIVRNETAQIRARVQNSIRTNEMGRIRQEAKEDIINTSRQELRREAVNLIVNDLRQNNLSALDRFRREEERRRNEQAEQIRIEREQQRKRQQEERIRIEQQRIRDAELNDVVRMFNSKMPVMVGKYQYTTPRDCNCLPNYNYIITPPTKYHINLSLLKSIEQENLQTISDIHKSIVDDIFWIKKYVFGNEDSKPFVDFVFDYYIDKLDNIIEEKEEYIRKKDRLNNWNMNQYFNEKKLENDILASYKKLKAIDKTREYYYINYEDSFFDYKKRYSRNVCWTYSPFEPHHKWMAEQEAKINKFLKKFIDKYNLKLTVQIDDPNPYWGPRPKINLDLLESHKNAICYDRKRYGQSDIQNGGYYMFFEKEDYTKLLELGYIFIEIIEFMRPEVIIGPE